MNGRASSPVLVGRGEYLAVLDAALARARDSVPSTVLIGGEAGIGKTRLTSEFVTRAADSGTRVLPGACLDMGTEGLPFAPFSAVLRELVRDLGADGVAGLLPGHATREVARLLPEFGAMEQETDASTARARLFEQILALLERLADERPVMLVIEDAHWADRSTRDLLAFLVGSQQVLDRVLIVVTFRSDDLHRTHPLRPLLAGLGRLSWVQRIELPRLDRRHADELAARILGRELAPSVADEVHRRAEGNPLFLEELLSRAGEPNAQLPESLRDLLLAAVRRLPEETQDVLRAASAAGPGIEHALLAAVTGLEDDALARAAAGGGRQRAGRPRRRVRVPARTHPRGGLRRPAARRAHPPAHPVRRGPPVRSRAGRARPGDDRRGPPLVSRTRHHLGADQRLARRRGRPACARVRRGAHPPRAGPRAMGPGAGRRPGHRHQPPGRPGAGGRGRADRGRERARHLLRHGRAERGGRVG